MFKRSNIEIADGMLDVFVLCKHAAGQFYVSHIAH